VISGASAVNTRVHTSLPSAHGAAGALGTRHSPRPLFEEGRKFSGKISGASRGENASLRLDSLTIESEPEASTHGASYPSPASVSEAWGGWHIESAANDVTGGGWLREISSFRMHGKTPTPGLTSFAPTLPTARKSSRGGRDGKELARARDERPQAAPSPSHNVVRLSLGRPVDNARHDDHCGLLRWRPQ
jgi:hypothetical protein